MRGVVGETRRTAGTLLLGLSLLATLSTAAFAAPTLICTGELGTFNVDLDEAASTATINSPARPDPDTVPPSVIPASSAGPFKAAFDAKTVSFDYQVSTLFLHNTIDRLTGVLLEYRGVNAPYDQAALRATHSYTCHVGKAQF
jgi:hypothetical protein